MKGRSGQNSGDFKQGFQCSLSLSNTSDPFSDKIISHSISKVEMEGNLKSESEVESPKSKAKAKATPWDTLR
jgi:hypothetical protein